MTGPITRVSQSLHMWTGLAFAFASHALMHLIQVKFQEQQDLIAELHQRIQATATVAQVGRNALQLIVMLQTDTASLMCLTAVLVYCKTATTFSTLCIVLTQPHAASSMSIQSISNQPS